MFDPLVAVRRLADPEPGHRRRGECEYLPRSFRPKRRSSRERRTTPLFGLGLVDAVPDSTFYAIARGGGAAIPTASRALVSVVTKIATASRRSASSAGRARTRASSSSRATRTSTRWASPTRSFPTRTVRRATATLLSCNPMPGVNDDGTGVAGVQRLHDVPRAAAARADHGAGRVSASCVFRGIGCAGCHRADDADRAESRRRPQQGDFHPYSDFLLHDMGSLGDGITQNLATGQLMRTAPLWGLRKITTLPARRPRHDARRGDPGARRARQEGARPVRRPAGTTRRRGSRRS